jgi:hypothetical protein
MGVERVWLVAYLLLASMVISELVKAVGADRLLSPGRVMAIENDIQAPAL